MVHSEGRESSEEPTKPSPDVFSEELRFDYVKSLYDREFEIKERLERKASAVFALPSTLVAALWLKPEQVETVAVYLAGSDTDAARTVILVLFTLLLVSLLTTLSYSVATLAVQQYSKEYPVGLYDFLFEPGRRYLQNSNDFLQEIGGRLALATEHNAAQNAIKSSRLNRAAVGLFVTVVMLLLFVTSSYTLGGQQ